MYVLTAVYIMYRNININSQKVLVNNMITEIKYIKLKFLKQYNIYVQVPTLIFFSLDINENKKVPAAEAVNCGHEQVE